jgi:hypothetical protein
LSAGAQRRNVSASDAVIQPDGRTVTGSPQPFTLNGFAFDEPIPVKNGKGTVTSGLIGVGARSRASVRST